MLGLLSVALIAALAIVVVPHAKTLLTASNGPDAGCPAPSGSAPAQAAAGAQQAKIRTDAVFTANSASPGAASPSPSNASPAPSASQPATPAPSASAPQASPTVTPTASAPATPSVPPSVDPSPTASPTGSASPTVAPTATATPTPCPSTSATATAPPPMPATNTNCAIIVPARPLTAAGLASPYQLTGPDGQSPQESGCTMANSANLGAFVQATILNPRTGALRVYEPLVITQGTTPAVAPVRPRLPRGAVVTIDIGFNGDDLTQLGATPLALAQGRCVDGLDGSVFGQVSYCNGRRFFRAAFRAQRRHRLHVPAVGTSPVTGKTCPTTRDFTIVDQDPSDNVTTHYLITASGQTAQSNAANAAALPGATSIVNGSDNALLDAFIDPALKCTPFEAPDLSQDGQMGTSQALNELSAAANQGHPAALIPENDEMVMTGGAVSMAKTDLYRAQVGQPAVSVASDADSSPAMYCQNMENVQTAFLAATQSVLTAQPSAVTDVGDNLFTFMANRLSMSFANLNCGSYGLRDTVKTTLDDDGVCTAATLDTTPQTVTKVRVVPPHLPRPGQARRERMNPAGT